MKIIVLCINSMSYPHYTYSQVAENGKGDRSCFTVSFEDTSTLAQCLERSETLFADSFPNNCHVPHLASLGNPDLGLNSVASPNMSPFSLKQSNPPLYILPNPDSVTLNSKCPFDVSDKSEMFDERLGQPHSANESRHTSLISSRANHLS